MSSLRFGEIIQEVFHFCGDLSRPNRGGTKLLGSSQFLRHVRDRPAASSLIASPTPFDGRFLLR